MSSAVLAGRFRIVAHAGKGASGDVFRAVDERTSREVAIKILARAPDDDALDRFSREVRMLASVVDPHVVRYVADGSDDMGRPFVAVEWLEGEDLAKRQRRDPLDGASVLEVVRQAALGLTTLHSLGIVHRDVKPSNLFLGRAADGSLHVTVIDLGVARAGGDDSLLTREGFMIGTPSYMSPEQVLGRRDVGPASDLFSLGVVLFELVARARPYRGDDVVTLAAKIALQEPPRLATFAPGAPPELDTLVATAMARDPGNRFSSAEDFAYAVSLAPPFVSERRESNDEEETRQTSGGTATTERRVVTTVVVRLRGTAEAASAAGPCERIAKETGGVLHKLLSLAYVLVFGGAVSTGDEAQRAARAALAIGAALPPARVSISTGRVVAGAAGLAGDAISARLGDADDVAGVVVDTATARLIGDAFEVVDRDGQLVVTESRAIARPVRTFLGRPAPFVGREHELGRLVSLYSEVLQGNAARAVLVVGEPGSGKSRLRSELERSITELDPLARFLVARATPLSEGSPFGMLRSAIRAFARICEGEPVSMQRAKLNATIRDGASGAMIQLMARLADVGAAQSSGAEDGALVCDQLRAAFEEWLRQMARSAPLCILLEDLHHGDHPSVSLIDTALGSLSDHPIFVVGFARPEVDAHFPALWKARKPAEIRLGKLGRSASAALARGALGAAATPELVESIVTRADGNAFYMEEILRAVTSSRAEPRSVSELPETVLGMVQARLDSLGPQAKRLLRAASVLGDVFWTGGVAEVLDEQAAFAVAATLDDLARQEVIERKRTARFQGEDEFAFRHALIRDAAYELLTDQDRALCHGRAGAWLEARGEREAIVLARHYDRGGKLERALPHYERAAEQALVGSDFAGAIDCAERALAYGASGLARGRALLTIAEARRWTGQLTMALEAASFAQDDFAPGSREWFHAMRELVAARGRLGQSTRNEIFALAERALAPGPAAGAESAQVAALVPAAVHLLYAGETQNARAVAARIETLASSAARSLEPRAIARLHQMRAAFASSQEDHETALFEQERALEYFELANDRRAAALVQSNFGFALMAVGALERAEGMLRTTLTIATKLGLSTIVPLSMQNLGATLARLGRVDEAFDMQRRAAELFAGLHDPRLEGSSRIHLALLSVARGDLDAAEREVAGVLAGSFEPLHVGAHAAISAARLRRGDVEGALRAAFAGDSILERLGSVEEFEPLARVTLVEALFAAGRYEHAWRVLVAARDRIQARAAALRDPELKRSFLERIEEHARLAEMERRLLRLGPRAAGQGDA